MYASLTEAVDAIAAKAGSKELEVPRWFQCFSHGHMWRGPMG